MRVCILKKIKPPNTTFDNLTEVSDDSTSLNKQLLIRVPKNSLIINISQNSSIFTLNIIKKQTTGI